MTILGNIVIFFRKKVTVPPVYNDYSTVRRSVSIVNIVIKKLWYYVQ